MPFRAQFQLVALGLGGTPDRRVELALPPGDFLYLDLNLLLPLDDLDLRLFRPDSLAGYGLLQGIRQLGLGPPGVDLLVIRGLFRVEVTFGLGDLGVGREARRLPLLVGLSFLDAGVALGLGYTDRRIPLDLRGPAYAKGFEIALLILDVGGSKS